MPERTTVRRAYQVPSARVAPWPRRGGGGRGRGSAPPPRYRYGVPRRRAATAYLTGAPPRPGTARRAGWVTHRSQTARVKATGQRIVSRPGPVASSSCPARADDATGRWQVEAAGAGEVLRVVSFAKGETDEGL